MKWILGTKIWAISRQVVSSNFNCSHHLASWYLINNWKQLQVLKFNGTRIKNIRHLAHLVDSKPQLPLSISCAHFLFTNSYLPLISMQGQVSSIWIRRQLHCCFGEGNSYIFFILHSSGLWDSIRKVTWSLGAICGCIGRQSSNNGRGLWR